MPLVGVVKRCDCGGSVHEVDAVPKVSMVGIEACCESSARPRSRSDAPDEHGAAGGRRTLLQVSGGSLHSCDWEHHNAQERLLVQVEKVTQFKVNSTADAAEALNSPVQ